MKLTLTSEIYPNKVFPATVEIVYPTIDPSSHTFQCKIVIPNAKNLLRPGMYVTTNIGLVAHAHRRERGGKFFTATGADIFY